MKESTKRIGVCVFIGVLAISLSGFWMAWLARNHRQVTAAPNLNESHSHD